MASLSSVSTSHELSPNDPDFEYLEERYKCCYCKHVLRNPVQTRCGHRLCEECRDHIFASGEPVACPAGEEDCELLKRNDIYPDTSVRREIQNLLVRCPNSKEGCSDKVPWKNIEKHVAECEFKPVDCRNKNFGCETRLTESAISAHEAECPYRQTRCKKCGQTYIFYLARQHEENDCPEVDVTCPYNCATHQMKRKELSDHLMTCPRKPKECKFKPIGCDFTGTAEELADHERDFISHHLELVTVFTSSMDLQNLDIKQRMQELTAERDDFKKKLADCQRENESLKNSVKHLEKTLKDLRVKMVGHTERLIILERKQEELPRKEKFEEHTRDVTNLKEKINQLQQQAMSTEGGATVARYGTLNAMADALTTQLAAHDRQIGIHDVRIAEMDLRFQILETANYDGVLIWKIKDYMKRKQEAITGRTLSLYSQPFYTSRYGYKLCARVYLNGDGMGKTTHISLFFVLMRGEYDALLPWPFQRKVTLYLLDQGPAKNDVTDHFHPDPSSSSFKRPTTEMNIASGCPLFASHAIVEHPQKTYLKDDTIYIKVVVDTIGSCDIP